MSGGGPGGMAQDVMLQYIDDDPDSYSNIFDNAKTDLTETDKTRLIASLKALSSYENLEEVLDLEEVLRYFVVHTFVVNRDSYTGSMIHNYYLYEEDGKLSILPWDYNLAFGAFQSADAKSAVNDPIDTPVTGGNLDARPMVGWIFSSEEYTEKYHALYSEFIQTCWESGYMLGLIEETEALISPYVEKDPTKFCDFEAFEKGVEALKTFVCLRAESVKGQLQGDIPSTADGQEADSSALVDASDLSISDMGTMESGAEGAGQMPGMMRGPMGQAEESGIFPGSLPGSPAEMPAFLGSGETESASGGKDQAEEGAKAETEAEEHK